MSGDEIQQLEKKLGEMRDRLELRREQLESVREHFGISRLDWISFMQGFPLRNDPVKAARSEARVLRSTLEAILCRLGLCEDDRRAVIATGAIPDDFPDNASVAYGEELEALAVSLDLYTESDEKFPY
jgi:hypothetical protein